MMRKLLAIQEDFKVCHVVFQVFIASCRHTRPCFADLIGEYGVLHAYTSFRSFPTSASHSLKNVVFLGEDGLEDAENIFQICCIRLIYSAVFMRFHFPLLTLCKRLISLTFSSLF